MTKMSKKISDNEKKGCFGKVKHKTKLAAEYVFDEMRGRHSGILSIYKCAFCNFYHIGHDVKHELNNIKNKSCK